MAPTARSRNPHTRKELQREIQKRQGTGRDKRSSDAPPTPAAALGGEGGGEHWTPTSYTALKALLSARLCAAIWSLVADCDETFNYWEPTHYLVYGTGFQTWEYAPTYALRSYTYVLLHAVPGKIYAALLQSNRMLVFFFIRCLLALGCSGCELYFYRGVCKEFGPLVGSVTIGVMIFSAGMFNASTALLPSSFAMYMTLMSMGAWYQQCPQLAIFTTAISAFLGWPFAAAIGLPIAYDIVIRKRQIAMFIKWCSISTVTILLPMVQIDSHYYGRIVVAPLNIVLYNVFNVGPDLYGTEPWSFYFVNGFLNFNFVFVAALLLLPLMGISYFIDMQITASQKDPPAPPPQQGGASHLPPWLAVAPLYLWLAIFIPQPHKEERFLYPVYPLVALAGALCLYYGQRLWHVCTQLMCVRRRTQPYTHWVALGFLAVTSVLSLSRIVGQYRAYHAPLETYMELNRVAGEGRYRTELPVNVCVGKEWHRFPSSFFLPALNWHLRFLESEFRGQLPQYYGDGPLATAAHPEHVNSMNKEEPSRYVSANACHFLVDLDDREAVTERQPSYVSQTAEWSVVLTVPFLNAKRSHRLLRAFYVPFLTESYSSYLNYTLLRRRGWRNGGEEGRKGRGGGEGRGGGGE